MRACLPLVAALLWPCAAPAQTVDRLVARVDGEPILLSELMRHASPRLAPLATEPAWKRAQALRAALRAEIDRAVEAQLLAALARRRGLTVTDAQIDAALARIAEDQHLTLDELWAHAEASGYSPAVYREEIRRQLVEQALIAVDPYRPAGVGWAEKQRAALVAALRRRACIERFGRW